MGAHVGAMPACGTAGNVRGPHVRERAAAGRAWWPEIEEPASRTQPGPGHFVRAVGT